MIPLVDDYIQALIVEKLRWLKNHPVMIDIIFQTGRRRTLEQLRDFILNKPVQVIIGYPKDQTSLPAYVITLAPENEQAMGLGDDFSSFEGYNFELKGAGDINNYDPDSDTYKNLKELHNEVSKYISGTFMNSNYRVECWSDNGDLTAYMYIVLKWCLWSSRLQMYRLNWVDVTLSGVDLEPVPDYFPFFIYRRSIQINMMYENLYFENLDEIEGIIDAMEHPETIPDVLPDQLRHLWLAAKYNFESIPDTLIKEWDVVDDYKLVHESITDNPDGYVMGQVDEPDEPETPEEPEEDDNGEDTESGSDNLEDESH